jgi:hypothetical protein
MQEKSSKNAEKVNKPAIWLIKSRLKWLFQEEI